MLNRIIIVSFISLFAYVLSFAQDSKIFDRWDATDQLIMEKRIVKESAIDSISKYVELANKYYVKHGYKTTPREKWIFPMKDWSLIDYRSGGNDYGDIYFDYFQGGESMNHPAHDIFIQDKDSNGYDDMTNRKVIACAMTNGIVFTVLSSWKDGDRGRGGNYVKIYDPESEAMFYYSHLDSIFVKPGDFVSAGDPVAYVGRTGRKAIKGKTHLHIAFYSIESGYPKPEDFIDDLYSAEKRYQKQR